jgi:SagB-type dehydrogenase family enzyme
MTEEPMLDATDTRSLALLYHLNSEPWVNTEAGADDAYHVEIKEMAPSGDRLRLPAPPGSALGELIARRSSCRAWAASTLALADLAAILAGGYGLGGTITFPSGLEMRTRSVPSAGGLYPLELYVSLQSVADVPDGLYHYNVLDHALEWLRAPLDPQALAEAVIPAPFLVNANALVFISGVFDRTLGKYGARGYRYILLEAGHAAQNLCLVAAERGLASLCVGGFMDAQLNRLLELDPRLEATVYCVGLGHAAEEHAPG